jgi:hypothetical protein
VWPRGQRSGGRIIHCPVVDCTNSPTAATPPSSRLSPGQHHQRQFPPDKVYRRGVIGVESLGPQRLGFVHRSYRI